MLQKLAPYILAASLFILGLSVGFFIGRNTANKPMSDITVPAQPESADNRSLYSSQTASIRGVITKRNGDILTVRNLNTQTTGTVKASRRIMIAKAGIKPGATSPASDLSKIELNKEVFISLEMVNDHYEAVSIQYVIPSPSLQPISNTATQSSQPKQ